MNKIERQFMRACEGLHLRPSRWIPHIKVPEGIYQKGAHYSSSEEMLTPEGEMRDGTDVYLPFFSVYELAWTWALKDKTVTSKGFWIGLWSFLHDVDMGIYDYRLWEDVLTKEEWEARRGQEAP